ncbi:MAG: bifunctional glutamate N-acetyltransferase/amino-acid acetyltransferase ArgJ [Clostridiaceae bacterium]|nr:bifunctional glutamate N-acetyltransferase/amino-acid acetyltransferase ArgJ [Clostridiaceae bacterium]
MKLVDGGITAPQGFQAAGVACGLKKDGAPDLALIVSDRPAAAAGVFTKNIVQGHSLQLSRRNIRGGRARAVVINSGNANACLGPAGDRDALAMAKAVADHLQCPESEILTGSTGVIGKKMNMPAIKAGIDAAFAGLDDSIEAACRAEQAIMTTDLIPKSCVVEFELDDTAVRVAGMAKGSGMIHPDMATMIGVITTDCAVDATTLHQLLRSAVSKTFNRVSVDGDTSVCDMVVILANGAAGNRPVRPDTPEAVRLLAAIEKISTELSRLIARDGEGATKLVEIRVDGAMDSEDAYRAVLAVARSPLVKTALFGEDANWGRILTAVGYSGASFDPARCDIYLGRLKVCENGCALAFDEAEAKRILQEKDILIRIVLGAGPASDRMWTCDFSYDYVRINGSYRS